MGMDIYIELHKVEYKNDVCVDTKISSVEYYSKKLREFILGALAKKEEKYKLKSGTLTKKMSVENSDRHYITDEGFTGRFLEHDFEDIVNDLIKRKYKDYKGLLVENDGEEVEGQINAWVEEIDKTFIIVKRDNKNWDKYYWYVGFY